MAASTPSGRSRFKIAWVIVPTPGPHSTITLARSQSTWERTSFTRNGELGIIDPSMAGCRKKLRANRTSCDERLADFFPLNIGTVPLHEILKAWVLQRHSGFDPILYV